MRLATLCLAAALLSGCGGGGPASTAPAPAPDGAAPGAVTLPTGYPERPFVRVEFDKLMWRPTEGNKLGVETAVVEGDHHAKPLAGQGEGAVHLPGIRPVEGNTYGEAPEIRPGGGRLAAHGFPRLR